MNNKSPISHFRGKYFCAQKQIFANFQQRQLEYGTNYRTITDTYQDPDTNLQEFPGYLDRGSPLIIVEGIGEDRRLIVIGIFQEQVHANDQGPVLFSRLNHEAFNWIVQNADSTHDSTCESFSSCLCGIAGKSTIHIPRTLGQHNELRR